ncbi:SdpI/YhfL protein family protein [Butyrivibrio sp. ob235]|uniref:SdpI family protein n=1 Tax=Butyrivibrio sp. ob235 TaxID=1761780 RepID=UPI0008D74EBD|nr:SdpI family protein [Butyrivibrio sp. ob235]SEL90347.1 SdpI/YhfL protein family protein [Butyrivibrio sp. ob235]
MAGIELLLFICVLICPVIAAIAGFILMKNPPKEINDTKGYRTKRSKSSQEAWDFANTYSGRNTMIYGIVALVLSGIAYVLVVKNAGFNPLAAMVLIILVQMVVMIIVMIVPTEKKLKEKFGE